MSDDIIYKRSNTSYKQRLRRNLSHGMRVLQSYHWEELAKQKKLNLERVKRFVEKYDTAFLSEMSGISGY